MTSLLRWLAVTSATVLLLASCGDADDPDDTADPGSTESSSGSGSEPSNDATDDPTDKPDKPDKSDKSKQPGGKDGTAETVAKERFCSDLDPEQIGDILGLAGLGVLVDSEPGRDGAQYWTCTIGQTTGTSVGVTLNILDAAADPSNVAATLNAFSTSLGPKNCTNVGDEALGAGTRGVDCSGTSSGTGFTMVARAAVIGGTQIECLLASYSPDDLGSLRAAAPGVCARFRDLVVS